MLRWAAATFDALGGDNARTERAFPTIMELRAFYAEDVRRDTVRPGSWVSRLLEAVDEGSIDPVLSQSLATHQKTIILFSARHIWTSSFRKFSLVWPKFWIIWHSRSLNVGLQRINFFKKKLCDRATTPACTRKPPVTAALGIQDTQF
jgi:hypothetical protein